MDNPYRLPRSAVPARYDVELAPDLDTSTFTGHVRIDVELIEPSTDLVLNAAELTIRSVTLADDGGAAQPVEFELDPATERMIVHAGRELAPGKAVLTIEFDGILNDRLRGFYRSTFTGTDGSQQVIAASQMQATDCRKAFPCWDEPEFKAAFGITLVVGDDLVAISNNPEAERSARGDGRTAIRFADTMIMSSYLVAVIVGRLEITPPVDVDGIELRLVHVPGKSHLASFGLEVGAFALRWFQEYYGIPYPGEKVDLVALPDFAAGAMENLGCITFRESLLLIDPATSTQAEQELVADVVCHEMAHMWFGDLVTMSWWNGIWLNEAFATFMEVAACDAFRPAWRRWTSFSLERTTAFETDSLGSTRPVEYEVRSPTDTEGMFDVLTYQKGGSLLRMLQQYLGEEPFRAGINHYLRTHSYANTETGDLWDAIEEVTGEPARRLMDSWIWQPGYPIVTATAEGGELVLRQQRFGFDDETSSDPSRWVIPVHVRQRSGDPSATASAAQETKVLLEDDEVRLPLLAADATVIVNSGGHGFFRVSYDDVLRSRLTDEVVGTMSTVERYMLVDDTWAGVVSGRLPARAFLELARSFRGERELQVWQALANGLRGCSRLVDGEALIAYRAIVRDITAPALAELGWESAAGEDDLTRQLRGLLVGVTAVLGEDADVIARARELFTSARRGETVDPELLAAATTVVAATGTVEDYEHFVDRFRTGATPQEQLRHLYALAEFTDEALMRRTCEFAFSGAVKSQNAPFLLGRCIANRDHGALAWRTIRERWTDAVSRFPSNTIVRMVDSVKLLNRPEQEADVQGFFAEHDIPQSAKTLQQILERQRVNVALRSRETDQLSSDIDELLAR